MYESLNYQEMCRRKLQSGEGRNFNTRVRKDTYGDNYYIYTINDNKSKYTKKDVAENWEIEEYLDVVFNRKLFEV